MNAQEQQRYLELQQIVSNYPLTVLEKLNTIATTILTPLDGELTSVDFAGMINQVFKEGGLADRYYPTWTDRSSSDFGRFLVELFALFSDKDMFYINHFSKESFLGVAEEYRSVFHKALNLGYNPPSRVSARGNVELIFSAGQQEVVPRGTILLGLSQMNDMVYTNEEFTIPQSTIDTNVLVNFVHGKIFNTQGAFDGNTIFVDTKGISTGSVRLIIDDVEWTLVNNFLDTNSSDKHFMVVHDEEGKAEILFAPKGRGARPSVGKAYFIEFIVGGGYVGDISDNTLDMVVTNGTTRNLIGFTQFAMVGGMDNYDLETLRQIVIGKRRHQNRVVTPEDAQYFLKEFSFVKKVKAEAVLGFLYLYILPASGGQLSSSQRSLIVDRINSVNDDERKLLMGYNMTVSSPVYVPIKMVITAYLSPNSVVLTMKPRILQILREKLDPLKNGEFGEGVNRGQIISYILQRLSGITNITFDTLHRLNNPQPLSDINFTSREVVDWLNSEITVNTQGGL